MHRQTSSAPGRADGRGFHVHAVAATTSEPFHCYRGAAHVWGLVRNAFAIVIGGAMLDTGTWLEERCKRCGVRRPFVGSVPQ